jgi:RHS repeat-associated protein
MTGSLPAALAGCALALTSDPLLISTHAGVTNIYNATLHLRFSATADKPAKFIPPSKNRVWDFFGETQSRTSVSWSQVVEPHRGIDPEVSTTAQDVEYTALYYYGYRFYSSKLGRWVNRDPIGEKGGVALYVAMNNQPSGSVDPVGKRTIPHVKFGVGISFGAAAEAGLGFLTGDLVAVGGIGYSLMFFPATCEVAFYTVQAGLGANLMEWRLPALEDFETAEDFAFFEAGIYAGFGVGPEAAVFLGSGDANADTFNGIFHTFDAAFEAFGLGLYVGEPDAGARMWVGGTITVGPPGFGLAKIDWDYQHNGKVWDLDSGEGLGGIPKRCLCHELRIMVGVGRLTAGWYF